MPFYERFDDEDGYNIYLGNIHCLFMNAFPMVSFARTPGDQIESSHPVPTSEKIKSKPMYCYQHNSLIKQNFALGNVVVIFLPMRGTFELSFTTKPRLTWKNNLT